MKVCTSIFSLSQIGRALMAAAIVCTSVPAMAQDGYGTLKGVIQVEGDVPAPAKVDANKDQAICLADGNQIYDQTLKVGEDKGLQGAFVMLYLKPRQKVKIHPDLEKPSDESPVLDNSKCIFVPANLAVRVGQELTLKNSDAAGHNCNIQSFKNSKNVNLPPNSELKITFDESDKTPAVVKCDIHPWMTAYMLIRDDPYFAVTDESGSFEIPKIPAGKWNFQFWHNRCGYMKEMTKDGDKFLGRRGEFEVEIKDGEVLDLGKLIMEAEELKEKN